MRTTVILPDDLGERFKAQAAAAGISQSDWIRDAIEAALISSDRSEHIPSYPPETDTAALRGANDRATRAEAEVSTLKAEIAHRDQVLALKADEISWLRGQVALLSERLAPPALPEKAGAGRRPWWRFWVTRE